MLQTANENDLYLSAFSRLEKDLAGQGRLALPRLRKAAISRFGELGFPGPRNEDWKHTNVTPIVRVPFQPAAPTVPSADELRRLVFFEAAYRLVFVNGQFVAELSKAPAQEGLVVTGLARALDTHADLVEPHLARYARYQDHPFVALNTALFRDGAFIFLPKGRDLSEPVHLLFIATETAEPAVSYPRSLVVAGGGSRATLVESYVGHPGGVYLTNAVTEVEVGAGASIDHYKVQREGARAYHVAALQVHQERDSRFSSHYLGFGGALVRNEVRAVLGAEGCECTLNGLYSAGGRQHMDNHTVIDHAKPRCASHELYKGILDGQAHGVFNGKIFVRQDAQRTDAKQTNQTLLLSDDATINTKPQLEIFADDVKCTHGATVGQLDDEAVFYLRSRGLGRDEARALLTFAFANDVIGRVRVDALRDRLERMLLERQPLPAGPAAQETP